MNRFDWSPTVELEPGVTYIPAAVDDNGRERMINCHCRTVPIIKEDIEVKLSEALVRQREIKRLTDELNVAINDAMINGLSVDVEVMEHHTMSTPEPIPVVTVTIKVNPEDIE